VPATSHPFESTPWSWLFAGRPVLFYLDVGPGSCGAAECRREIVALGTPLLWWSFLPALLMAVWGWLARRDWRAAAILLCAAAGWLPWMLYPDRTMFYFYILPALPFLVLAVVYGLGVVLGPATAPQDRRATGALFVALYVAVIVLTFLYFSPEYTGAALTPSQWDRRLWFDSWF
jgi:dolichyl-phosphate-mannose--protein O-mannosyl transferase